MNNLKIVGPAMPDMPWEDRPAGSKEVMWRYSANPIIPRDALSTSNSIFNSAVIPFTHPDTEEVAAEEIDKELINE